MPYIQKEERVELDAWMKPLIEDIESAGQLNYVISKIVHGYVLKRTMRYGLLNEAVGVLECAKEEFIRTVVSPYEDKKIEENGPVSDLDRERIL
jgi:hypothetical protein